jgi:D-citramalate synthase
MDTTPVMVNKPQSILFCRRKANHCTIVVGRINVDRIEIASARVSEGEFQGVKGIMTWLGQRI